MPHPTIPINTFFKIILVSITGEVVASGFAITYILSQAAVDKLKTVAINSGLQLGVFYGSRMVGSNLGSINYFEASKTAQMYLEWLKGTPEYGPKVAVVASVFAACGLAVTELDGNANAVAAGFLITLVDYMLASMSGSGPGSVPFVYNY